MNIWQMTEPRSISPDGYNNIRYKFFIPIRFNSGNYPIIRVNTTYGDRIYYSYGVKVYDE